MLSTSILGSLESMVLPLILIVTVVALIFRRALVKIYSRAEVALHETLVELPRVHPEESKVLPELLHEAENLINNTYRPLEIYTAVAVVFAIMIYPFIFASQRLERHWKVRS